ncbi:alkaline phosphatase PhoX [Vibrio tasmaniensis]|uniref:alkaline phosphatase PhoX n=1 Tax=Vibrio tasmaniensis TaxID=212663 RepID=UPI00111A55BE|nr:alkaline phosphatase PhoX [Vibrio tasmaniensis]
MVSRRRLIAYSLLSTPSAALLLTTIGCNDDSNETDESDVIQSIKLLDPDENGAMLISGFSSKIIAKSSEMPSKNSSYLWHNSPDGGAVFSTEGGWVYVSNSEESNNLGGVGALKFNTQGELVDAYQILSNTNRNCAGGSTPWGTWLSCEEIDQGNVWECDPLGVEAPTVLPALGTFNHEAVAVDINNDLYLTEDKPDGGFYKYISNDKTSNKPDLQNGTLYIAIKDDNQLSWQEVPDPTATLNETRYQVNSSATFNGGEGITYEDRVVYFVTKGDNKVWAYNIDTQKIEILYDASMYSNPVLTGVDNITLAPNGSLVIAEDGGNLQLVMLSKAGELYPLIQLVGHDSSEITGPAFSPDGKRLYFSSQDGTSGEPDGGITFEIFGDFSSLP